MGGHTDCLKTVDEELRQAVRVKNRHGYAPTKTTPSFPTFSLTDPVCGFAAVFEKLLNHYLKLIWRNTRREHEDVFAAGNCYFLAALEPTNHDRNYLQDPRKKNLDHLGSVDVLLLAWRSILIDLP
jgi:hypothetical protein